MRTLLAQDKQRVPLPRGRQPVEEKFGPDPVLMKKRGLPDTRPRDISEYKKKIVDETYLDHAINRIAMELSHFLLR